MTDVPCTEGRGRPAASSFMLSSTEELGQEGLSFGFHRDREGGVGEEEREGGGKRREREGGGGREEEGGREREGRGREREGGRGREVGSAIVFL